MHGEVWQDFVPQPLDFFGVEPGRTLKGWLIRALGLNVVYPSAGHFLRLAILILATPWDAMWDTNLGLRLGIRFSMYEAGANFVEGFRFAVQSPRWTD